MSNVFDAAFAMADVLRDFNEEERSQVVKYAIRILDLNHPKQENLQLEVNEPGTDGEWMPIRRAARVLKVTDQTVRNRIRSGQLESRGVNGITYVLVNS